MTKNVLKWGGIGLGVIMLLVLLFRGGKIVANSLFPKKPPPPEAAYGKLPKLIFPESATGKTFSYSLDTLTGDLGAFPDRSNVYKIIHQEPTLLDLETTRSKAYSVGFKNSETLITDTRYSFRDPSLIDRLLTINTVSKDFTISSNYLNYPDLLTTGEITEANAIQVVADFLDKLGLYPSDFDLSKTSSQLLSLQGGSLFASSSLSTAQLVRVDLFQKDINKLPIIYAHPPYSSMHFLVGGDNSGEILDASFSHQIVDKDNTAYPIISVTDAYNKLKNDQAYIASYFGDSNEVTIKDVSLAYYMDSSKQDYLMPIFVFEGKDGFFAYVLAVSPSYID